MNPYERLTATIRDLSPRVRKMRDALRRINDAPDFERLLDTIEAFARIHGEEPDPGLANEFASLRSDLGQYTIDPDAIEDENVRERWEALDAARGNLYIALDRVLSAARALNMVPERVEHSLPASESIDRRQVGLGAIHSRLKAIEEMLRDRIVPEGHPGAGRPIAQLVQVNQYVRIMRRNLTLFGLTLSAGDQLDLSALERVVARMGRLTRDFHSTVTSAMSRATLALRQGAGMIRKPVGRLARGLGTVAQVVMQAEKGTGEAAPPPGFSIEAVYRMIRAGEMPPEAWWPFIRRLDLDFASRLDIELLRPLYALESLSLRSCGIADIDALSGLSRLESLDLVDNPVHDLAPLAGLTELRSLDLNGTKVTEIDALAGLTSLEDLSVPSDTLDLGPLKNLKKLRYLQMRQSNARHIPSLSGLPLVSLSLWGAKIEDFSWIPTSDNLKTLDLSHTGLKDFGLISRFRKVNSLRLAGLRITDLTPLADLRELTVLNLAYTPVEDLTPLAGLTQLTTIDLDNSAVEDLTPLAGMPLLERIDIVGAPVKDLAPLAGLDQLQQINVESDERAEELASTFPRPGVVRRGGWLSDPVIPDEDDDLDGDDDPDET